jgi:4-aminobutyrate aminotransferase-like enzyme
VGLEVLNIIVENDLPGNAARVGARLKEGLEKLAGRHACIGQVRG